MKRFALIALACMLTAGPVLAGEPNTALIPASAKWVAHIDMKAVTGSQLGAGIIEIIKAEAGPAAEKHVQEVLAVWAKLSAVNSVTLFGPSHVETEAVAMFDLAYEKAKIMEMLGVDPNAATDSYQGHTIHNFIPKHPDKEGKRFVCFYDKQIIVAGGSLDRLGESIDLLDGKGKALPEDGALSTMLAPTKGSLFIAAATDVNKLMPAPAEDAAKEGLEAQRAAMVKRARDVRFEVGEAGEEAFVTVDVAMLTVEDGENTRQAIMGIIALMSFQQAEDPDLAKLLGAIKIGGAGAMVTGSIRLPIADILEKITAEIKRKQAAADALRKAAEAAPE